MTDFGMVDGVIAARDLVSAAPQPRSISDSRRPYQQWRCTEERETINTHRPCAADSAENREGDGRITGASPAHACSANASNRLPCLESSYKLPLFPSAVFCVEFVSWSSSSWTCPISPRLARTTGCFPAPRSNHAISIRPRPGAFRD